MKDLRWKNRIIIAEQAKFDQGRFDDVKEGIVDRDLVYFVLVDGELHTNHKLPLDADAKGRIAKLMKGEKAKVLLIGKDGGVKMRAEKMDFNKIFALIDTMPMRKREMRQ